MVGLVDERFDKAVKIVQSLPKSSSKEGLQFYQLSNEEKLAFYSLYKQATNGDCFLPAPPFYKVEARAKWFVILI